MKRQSFRASRGKGEIEFKLRIKDRERYNESSSLFNNTSKLPRFAQEEGRGGN